MAGQVRQVIELPLVEAAWPTVLEDAALCPALAQAAHQRPGVNSLEPRHVPGFQKILEPRTRLPVVRLLGQLAHDECRNPRPNRLIARVRAAVVADLRLG